MREKLLLLIITFFTTVGSAQFVLINTPEDCAGALNFGEANAWGAVLTSDIWTGDVAIVDDGSALPTEGCNTLINGAEISGKIALVDRGSCNFSLKALNAQNEGAIACVIANHTPGAGVIQMGAGNFAAGITIPVVMISYEDGQLIKEKLNSGTVNMTIGNFKFGNDVGASIEQIAHAPYGVIPASQIQKPQDYAFYPAASVTNNGINSASNVTMEAVIEHTDLSGNTTEVYRQAGIAPSLDSDSSEFIMLQNFDPEATGEGAYNVTYTFASDSTDDADYDNVQTASFNVAGTLYSKGRWDAANNRPVRTNGFTIAGGGPIEMITPFEIPNGEGYMVDSVLYHVSTNNATLTGIVITIYVYNWVDANGDGGFSADEVSLVALGVHDFGTSTVDDEWVKTEIVDINSGEIGYVLPADNQNIIIGTRYDGPDFVFFGFDDVISFDQYINQVLTNTGTYNDAKLPYAQTTTFGSFGADFDAIGLFTDFWGVSTTSITINEAVTSTKELSDKEVSITLFPNPSSDVITVDLKLDNVNTKSVRYVITDVQGRTIYSQEKDGIKEDRQQFDVSQLTSGSYELVVRTDQGFKSTRFIVE